MITVDSETKAHPWLHAESFKSAQRLGGDRDCRIGCFACISLYTTWYMFNFKLLTAQNLEFKKNKQARRAEAALLQEEEEAKRLLEDNASFLPDFGIGEFFSSLVPTIDINLNCDDLDLNEMCGPGDVSVSTEEPPPKSEGFFY